MLPPSETPRIGHRRSMAILAADARHARPVLSLSLFTPTAQTPEVDRHAAWRRQSHGAANAALETPRIGQRCIDVLATDVQDPSTFPCLKQMSCAKVQKSPASSADHFWPRQTLRFVAVILHFTHLKNRRIAPVTKHFSTSKIQLRAR